MKTVWDDRRYAEIVSRIRALTPDHRPRWGRMNPPQILAHMADQIRMGLGDIPARRGAGLLSIAPINYLLIYVVPWPHGAKGPYEAFTTSPTTWDADRDQLIALIDRLRQNRNQSAWPEHPLFGKLSAEDWAALSYKHLSHHLRQLGV